MKRKLMTAFLAVILSVSVLPPLSEQAYAYSEGSTYRGSDCTDHEHAAAAIDYAMSRYPHGKAFDSAGTCWGYAVKINELLSAGNKTSYYNGLRFTKSNFKKKCLNAKAGTHIRFSHGSTFNGGYGHSVILLKTSANRVIWADNNYYSYNIVSYYEGTLNDFYRCYGQYGYINMVSKPVKYKTYQTPKAAVKVLRSPKRARISWLKASGAVSYQVYRSYAKNGDYELIAETKADTCRYTDKTARKGRKVYYKIKAVKNNENKWSSPVSCTL